MVIDFVPLKVSSQHVPQFGESKPETANAPPMFGKPDAWPSVVQPPVAGRRRETSALSYVIAGPTEPYASSVGPGRDEERGSGMSETHVS